MNAEAAAKNLLDAAGILEAAELPYFLILGTCLGAIREGGFIKHDVDIDLGCLAEDLKPRAERIVNAAAAAGFAVRTHYRPVGYVRAISMTRNRIKIDLAGFLKTGQLRYSPSSHLDCAVVYPAEVLEQTEAVVMLGREFRAPTPVSRYLELQYGPTWKVPNPAWRPQTGPARRYKFRGGTK